MTRYILHGGTKKVDGVYLRDYEFLREMLKTHEYGINVLLCYFAKDPGRWAQMLEEDKRDFLKIAGNKELIFHVADEERFAAQLAGADIVYFRGGDGHLIRDKLSLTPDLAKLLVGKTVAASSAGTNILAKYYYDNDYQQIEDGLGVLNIKTICHYKPEMQEVADRLKFYNEDIQMICLPEDEYTVLEQ